MMRNKRVRKTRKSTSDKAVSELTRKKYELVNSQMINQSVTAQWKYPRVMKRDFIEQTGSYVTGQKNVPTFTSSLDRTVVNQHFQKMEFKDNKHFFCVKYVSVGLRGMNQVLYYLHRHRLRNGMLKNPYTGQYIFRDLEVDFDSLDTTNIVASFSVDPKFTSRLETIETIYNIAKYNPDSFPCVTIKIEVNGRICTINLFGSGKFMVMGNDTTDDIYEAFGKGLVYLGYSQPEHLVQEFFQTYARFLPKENQPHDSKVSQESQEAEDRQILEESEQRLRKTLSELERINSEQLQTLFAEELEKDKLKFQNCKVMTRKKKEKRMFKTSGVRKEKSRFRTRANCIYSQEKWESSNNIYGHLKLRKNTRRRVNKK